KEDGSFRLNMKYFDFLGGDCMTNLAFADLFGGEARTPETRITQREVDLAASIQRVIEEAMLKLVTHAKEITGCENLVLAGGVALNCVSNARILDAKIFRNLWIQPAAGDAGGALGAALLGFYTYFGCPRKRADDSQKGSLLGPSFSSNEVVAFLERQEAPYS